MDEARLDCEGQPRTRSPREGYQFGQEEDARQRDRGTEQKGQRRLFPDLPLLCFQVHRAHSYQPGRSAAISAIVPVTV